MDMRDIPEAKTKTKKIEGRIEYKEKTTENEKSGTNPSDVLKDIVSHLVNAEDMKLLQLTPLPRNTIFDIAFDITQRAIVNRERIRNMIPLSAVWMEVYLRATRGADKALATNLYILGGQQLQAQMDNSDMKNVDV